MNITHIHENKDTAGLNNINIDCLDCNAYKVNV